MLASAHARRATSGGGLSRCSARCVRRSWSPTSSLTQCRDQRVRESLGMTRPDWPSPGAWTTPDGQ
eukprot:116941-Pyramimonas_sp.AAC.1